MAKNMQGYRLPSQRPKRGFWVPAHLVKLYQSARAKAGIFNCAFCQKRLEYTDDWSHLEDINRAIPFFWVFDSENCRQDMMGRMFIDNDIDPHWFKFYLGRAYSLLDKGAWMNSFKEKKVGQK